MIWRTLLGFLVVALTLIPVGVSVSAQDAGKIPVPPKKYGNVGKAPKINPALGKLSDDYKAYVGRNAGNDQGFQSDEPFMPSGNRWVSIDAVAAGDTIALKTDLEMVGLRNGTSYGRIVSGQLPIAALEGLQTVDSLNSARPAYATTNVGSVTSQGDQAMRSDVARNQFGLDGAGITVGTLSDSFNCLPAPNDYAADIGSGDLPAGISILQEITDCTGSIDEGRAMMQLIHDSAPGSNLAFHSAFNGMADFAQGIIDLRTAGSDVIVDDVFYFFEPMFQDGVIARAVDTVVSDGASYFSSAGNRSREAYESAFVPSGQFPLPGLGQAHDFGGGDIFQGVTLQPGSEVRFIFQWDQPIFDPITGSPGSSGDMDLWIMDSTGSNVLRNTCTASNINGDPIEDCSYSNNESVPLNINLLITNFSGPNPGLMKVLRFESGAGISAIEHDTQSGTAYGHTCAAGAEAVGAAFYGETPAFGQNPPLLEPFSSAGPCPILFEADGTRKSVAEVRQKPEIVAPDGTNTTFFGWADPPCCEGDGFPNFFGTSAAAPHAAAGAALMKQAFPAASGPDIYSALENSAIDMNGAGFDFDTGFGLVQIDLALLEMDTGPPETSIVSAPPSPDANSSPTFEMSGTDNLTLTSNLTFECQLDGAAYSPCSSPHVVGPLLDGGHTFNVRAIDEADNLDPSPATHSWTIGTGVNVTGKTTLQFRSSTAGRALVEISCPSLTTNTIPADDGTWQITGVPAETCTLTATAPGYLTAQGQIVVSSADVTVPANELLAGDALKDGTVDFIDITTIISLFVQPTVDCEIGGKVVDWDCGGEVDFLDITRTISNFPKTTQPFPIS